MSEGNTHELSDVQIRDAREVFNTFDLNKDGLIDEEELGYMMRSLGKYPSKKELRGILDRIDTNKNHVIEFDEFIQLYKELFDHDDTEDDIIDAFRMFDKDNNGRISKNELAAVVNLGGGEPMSQQDIEEMIEAAEPDTDGFIDYASFVRRLMNE